MFALNVRGDSGEQADASLSLLPTVPKIQESGPLEEIALIRDEMANMVWAIERLIPLPTGWSKPGPEAAIETFQFYEARLADDLEATPARFAAWTGHRDPLRGDELRPGRVDPVYSGSPAGR